MLSGIIINKNLRLLLINYLALKVDFLFHFPSKSQYTSDRTYGKTVYIHVQFWDMLKCNVFSASSHTHTD